MLEEEQYTGGIARKTAKPWLEFAGKWNPADGLQSKDPEPKRPSKRSIELNDTYI